MFYNSIFQVKPVLMVVYLIRPKISQQPAVVELVTNLNQSQVKSQNQKISMMTTRVLSLLGSFSVLANRLVLMI